MISMKQKKTNSLFSKGIIFFAVMSFASFLLTGVLLSRFMLTYSMNEDRKQMKHTADMIMSSIDTVTNKTPYLPQFTGREYYESIYSIFAELASKYHEITNSHIYIIEAVGEEEFFADTDRGLVIISAPKLQSTSPISGNLHYRYNQGYYLTKNQYDSIVRNESFIQNSFIYDEGDFNGLYAGTGSKWFTVASRITAEDAMGQELTLGIIVISKPITSTSPTVLTVLRYFLLSTCVALLVSILLAAFFTKRITEPIDNLKLAANAVSKGDFRGRIEYAANDDMGELIQAFNSMMKSLEVLNETKNDFIANVSHELRTPITTIGGFIDGMLDGTIPEEKRDYYLKIVRDEVIRMNKLVNDQLQMARLQQGITNLKQGSFDINEMIRQEIIKNEKNIEDKQIEIVVEFEEDKQNVYAEKESINRVMINLLNNAIKFTPEGGTITLGTRKKKGLVEIYVKDTGVGVPKEDLERIFERYFKSDRSRSMDKMGTGLGLSICKSIINAHNHKIQARNNTDGPGTTFMFWLDSI